MPEDSLDVCCYRRRLPDVIVARLAGEGGGGRRYVPEGRCEDLEKAIEAWRHECDDKRDKLLASWSREAALASEVDELRELVRDLWGAWQGGEFSMGPKLAARMRALGVAVRGGGRDEGDAPTDIAELDLSVSTYNRLKRSGVHTVGQLGSMSDRELLAIRDLGPKRVSEIRERLAARRAGKGEADAGD